jgi:hypothetical protein
MRPVEHGGSQKWAQNFTPESWQDDIIWRPTKPRYQRKMRSCTILLTTHSRSQWPRGIRHEMYSPAQTRGAWVRIALEAWMSVCLFCVCDVPWNVILHGLGLKRSLCYVNQMLNRPPTENNCQMWYNFFSFTFNREMRALMISVPLLQRYGHKAETVLILLSPSFCSSITTC